MGSNRLTLDANGVTEARIGGEGLSREDWEKALAAGGRALAEVLESRDEGRLGFWGLPAEKEAIEASVSMGREIRERFEDVVVLGIGGSSLGARAVASALGGGLRNLRPREQRGGPRLFFPDNSDPATFHELLSLLRPETTCFLAITKSGSTAETLSQLAIARAWLGDAHRDRVIAITDPEKGSLRAIAGREGWRSLPVPPPVGGRFSVLTAVGLLPLAAAGLDVHALCEGADAMRRRCEEADPRKNPAALLATVLHAFDRRGKHIHVLFSYADALRDLGAWYVQLWAESLGKSEEVGPTPVAAVGATDQHSLLQLLMEGPRDKVVLFVTVEDRGEPMPIPTWHPEEDALGYLGGKTLAGLIDAEAVGTQAALEAAGRPTLTIRLPRVDAHAVGELLFLWEAATAIAGPLFGVNPFDQPGVEASKKITQGLLGRAGHEEHVERLRARPAPDPAWILD